MSRDSDAIELTSRPCPCLADARDRACAATGDCHSQDSRTAGLRRSDGLDEKLQWVSGDPCLAPAGRPQSERSAARARQSARPSAADQPTSQRKLKHCVTAVGLPETSWVSAGHHGTMQCHEASLDRYFRAPSGSGTIRLCACLGTSRKRFSSICSTRRQVQLRRRNS